jgi:hypothetical protein
MALTTPPNNILSTTCQNTGGVKKYQVDIDKDEKHTSELPPS